MELLKRRTDKSLNLKSTALYVKSVVVVEIAS